MTEMQTKHDSFILGLLSAVGAMGFLIGWMISGFFVGLLAGVVVFLLPCVIWVTFFRAPTTRSWIIAGFIFIPLYICYVLGVIYLVH
jgi:hypothetical protein